MVYAGVASSKMLGRTYSVLTIATGLMLLSATLRLNPLGFPPASFGWKQLLAVIFGLTLIFWGILIFQAGGSFRGGWYSWHCLAVILATWQARIMYSAVYLCLVPLGMLFRWLSDPLHLRDSDVRQSLWQKRTEPRGLKRGARSQF